MNFDNGHRARQGQHNSNKRGRGRNNRRPGGGGGGHSGSGGGGNPVNRVYESNGPDVKVRGTAQTVAEKYMQLGRDAQSSGDNVMAESYFQFSEHYFRVMAAAQPVGQPTQQLRRPEDEDFDEEGGDAGEGESEAAQQGMASEGGPAGMGEQSEGGEAGAQDMDRSEQRNSRQRENRDGNRERFRPRWQNRGDQQRDGDNQPRPAEPEAHVPSEPAVAARPSGGGEEAGSGQWEAPSFLRRPTAAPIEAAAEPVAEKKVRSPRRSRAAIAADEAPQGE
ncbi:MAG: DUF4167 domain-containing protein [Aestuariivirga sp.]